MVAFPPVSQIMDRLDRATLRGRDCLQRECCERGTSDAWKEFSMLLCDIASLSRLSIRMSIVRNFNKTETKPVVRTGR
jgi:hypothetical protein